MNWKDVPLPKRMQALPKDARGFPIPHIVAYDSHGKPQFTVNDQHKVLLALTDGLCAICGQPLPKSDVWMVGGPRSAFDPRGCYVDGPLHGDCARYALRVCPYLAVSMMKYRSMKDLEKMAGRFDGTKILFDPTVDPDRPILFAMVRTEQIGMTPNGYLVPQRPYLDAEFWSGGEEMTRAEATVKLAEIGLDITKQIVWTGI
jgi:hypothetical protein